MTSYLVVSISVFLLINYSRLTQSVDPDEACPVFPQITANPNTVHKQESPIGQRPWVVLIWASCGTKTGTCEGSLIREEWVVTSANCLPCGADTSIVVDVGLHYNNIRREIILGRSVERVGAYSVHVHPNYEGGLITNNIALIHLTKKLNSSLVINLVECNQKESIETGRNCLSAGWGASLGHSLFETKMMEDTFMGIWSSQSCSRYVNTNGRQVVCAGAKLYSNITSPLSDNSVRGTNGHQENESDPALSCHVQIGASLVISQPKLMVASDGQVDISCEWQLCGVLARGMRCGVARLPGIYTDVCAHEDWIADTIRLAEG